MDLQKFSIESFTSFSIMKIKQMQIKIKTSSV